MLRKTDATEGLSGREPSVSRTSRSEMTLQEQTIIASPSLERLQTTFYISRLHLSPVYATHLCRFPDMEQAANGASQRTCRCERILAAGSRPQPAEQKKSGGRPAGGRDGLDEAGRGRDF
jgi:hypothetical protein